MRRMGCCPVRPISLNLDSGLCPGVAALATTCLAAPDAISARKDRCATLRDRKQALTSHPFPVVH